VTVAAQSVEEALAAVAEAGARGVSCRRSSGCGHAHLDLRRLRAVRFYQPGDLTVGCDAGMTAAELNRVLAREGQFVPLDVADAERTTLGAILAQHLSGPLRPRFGTVRDFTIGMEMIAMTEEGPRLVHSGGRVVKNVAGYDWMKLAIGARGGFGIITGVNFKVFPLPKGELVATFSGLSGERELALRRRILHSPLRPLAVEVEAGSRVQVRCAGSEWVLERCRTELQAMAEGGVEVSFDAGIQLAARRGVVRAGVAGDAVARDLQRKLKAELDPLNRFHGDDCE
jgi:FAD/FMN-containing dehydrogenase